MFYDILWMIGDCFNELWDALNNAMSPIQNVTWMQFFIAMVGTGMLVETWAHIFYGSAVRQKNEARNKDDL